MVLVVISFVIFAAMIDIGIYNIYKELKRMNDREDDDAKS